MSRLEALRLSVFLSLPLAASLGLSSCCALFEGSPPASSGTTASEEPAPEGDGWYPMPEPGPVPSFDVPEAVHFELSNGIPVTFVRYGDVPLVNLRINLDTGSSADPAGKSGLASFTADMLNEGTATRDALTLSDSLQTLASGVGLGANLDYSWVQLDSLTDNLDPTLELVADMIQAPSFPEDDIERVRGDRMNILITARDRIATVGYEAFARVLYGDAYLGRSSFGNLQSIGETITREDMVGWHAAVWTADNASIVVAGRIEQEELTSQLEKHFGTWAVSKDAVQPEPIVPQSAPHEGITLYWIDRPGSEQSYISVGNLAPAWDAERQLAGWLGNNVLGGYFTARLNMNLREDKGYTYGARTSLSAYELGGMFRASASVKSATTAASLVEFLAEIRGLLGEHPITEEEFESAQSRAVQGQPASYEGRRGVLSKFGDADAKRRPDGWLQSFVDRVSAVERTAAQAEFSSVVSGENLAIVVVGDWSGVIPIPAETADGRPRPVSVTIGEQVEALQLGPVVLLSEDGSPVPSEEVE